MGTNTCTSTNTLGPREEESTAQVSFQWEEKHTHNWWGREGKSRKNTKPSESNEGANGVDSQKSLRSGESSEQRGEVGGRPIRPEVSLHDALVVIFLMQRFYRL